MKKNLPMLMALLLLVGCKSKNTVQSSENQSDEKVEGSELRQESLEPFYCEDLKEKKILDEIGPMQEAYITSYKQVDGCACINYQYSGCREGQVIMVQKSQSNVEGNRPVVMLKLLVEKTGDCDQLLTDSTCFSMKKMKLVANEVIVQINQEENNILLNFNDSQ